MPQNSKTLCFIIGFRILFIKSLHKLKSLFAIPVITGLLPQGGTIFDYSVDLFCVPVRTCAYVAFLFLSTMIAIPFSFNITI